MGSVINIVGCGPGSSDCMTREAVSAVKSSSVVVGSERLLALFPWFDGERVPIGSDMSAALDRIESLCAKGPVAVLVSGDPGLFSLSKLVIKRFGRDLCRVIPGISSIQAAFARLALDWTDARIISAHVSDPDESLMSSLAGEPKIAVLLGRSDSTKWVITFLKKYPRDRQIFVCENLTLGDERIREIQAAELLTLAVSPNSLVLLIDRGLLE